MNMHKNARLTPRARLLDYSCRKRHRIWTPMPMKRFLVILIHASVALFACSALAQMKVDLPAETARRAAKKTYVDDLAVRDTALIYQNLCVENGSLFVPGWTVPADLANSTYQQTGITLRIEVLPGKKLKGTLIDAAQAQAIAKGRTNEPKVLSEAAFNEAVIDFVNNLYSGGWWGVTSCEEERRTNPLRTLNLLSLESINGFSKVSELLASVTGKAKAP
jgi:hypothetical protein